MSSYQPGPCPVCGATGGRTIADRADLQDELERLWAFHLRRLRRGVPVERLADRVVFTQPLPLRVARCHRCGLVRRDPLDAPRQVDERYRDASVEPEALEALFHTQLATERGRARRLTRIAGGAGQGIEVGCYTGAFLAAAAEVGWRFEGVDVNEVVIEHVRRKGLAARLGEADVLGDAGGLGEGRWDAVALWTCLDQLPDPRAAVRAAARALRPGGVLAVRVPSGAFYARLRPRLEGPLAPAAERLLAWNNLLGFPYLHGFTRPSLRRLLECAGLRVVQEAGGVLVRLSDRWSRRWAVAEEALVKGALRRLPVGAAPWLEVYARSG
ncbi:MAG: methyltransferase domain-containing protein [Gemmatimonadota bacterium]